MSEKKAICPITGYSIEYTVDVDLKEAYINNINCDFLKIKPLALLIRTSIEDLKKSGILTLKQYVHVDEFHRFLEHHTTWEIDAHDYDIYKIKCPINDAINNVAVGLGIV